MSYKDVIPRICARFEFLSLNTTMGDIRDFLVVTTGPSIDHILFKNAWT